MNNKKAKGWILCPSKSFPGHFYYFNLSTGAVHWSLSDDQKNLIKKDIQKADAFHSYPEPNSPLENANISKNIFIEEEKHNSKSQQTLFAQTSFPQYISNVHLSPKRPTVQKHPYYSELPTFGKVTFPKYISVPRLESDVKKEIYKQSTPSTYKLNSSKMTNKFDIKNDRICKTNVYNKKKHLLKEPVLKKNIVENYFLLSNSNQIQSNSMYRNPFALKQFKNNYRSNHLPIKENNFTVSKSDGTQTSFSNSITENNSQYTLKSRELHKNKQNHFFFQNNRSSSPSVQSLSSPEPEIYSPLRTDQTDTLIMKNIDGHTFQLNGSDNYQNIPMDIEKNNLSQINIIANDDIRTNTNHSIVQSPESYEMPVSNKNGQDITLDNYFRTFRECNRKSHENVFYFGNEINTLRRDTFEGENEINAAIKNKIYIREENDQDRRLNENNTTYNTYSKVQDLIDMSHDTSIHNYNAMPVEYPQYINDKNIFKKDKRGKTRDALCMETLAGNDLRYVLDAKQQAKKIEMVSNKTVENNKKHVTFALNENSIIENGNYFRKNVFNSRNSFTLKDLKAIQIEVKNNITEDGNIFNDTTSSYEAYDLRSKVHYVSSCPPKTKTSKKNHIDNGCDEVCTPRMRVDRNETNQSRFVNDQILPNLNNSNYEILNYEGEYQQFLNSRGNVDKKMEFIISNSNFEFENEHRVSNIDNSLKRFDVDCEEIEHRVKLRIDEWVCCFTQIMEEFLEGVVKQSFIRLDPPPPWSFDEILTCTKTIYEENTKIVTIVDRIIALFREIQFRDHKLKCNLKASHVTKMIGGGMLLLESFQEILPNYNTEAYQKISNLLRCICDPNTETHVSLEIDNPKTTKEYDDLERYNVVKSRSEILDYLKKHYPSWRNYTEDINGKINKDNQQHHIIRTIGRNLNSLKIDKNNNLTLNGVSKNKQNEMTKLSRVVNNDRNDVTNDNDKNVNDYPKIIVMEDEVNFDKYSNLRKSYCDVEKNSNLRCTDKNTNDIFVCNNDIDNEKIQNDKLTVINDNCHNGELSEDKVDAVITDSRQSLGESVNTYALIKLFLIHLSKTLRTIYRFLHDNVAHFRENNFTHENKIMLREKISKTHAYLGDIIIKLKRIIDRESNDTELKAILANYSEALEDIRVIKYRNIVMKCLEQAQILQRAMKIMLHIANESQSPVSSYNCVVCNKVFCLFICKTVNNMLYIYNLVVIDKEYMTIQLSLLNKLLKYIVHKL